jgi:hypothetical protein
MKVNNGTLFLALMLALTVVSCSRKKETDTIITKIELPKVSRETKSVGTGDVSKTFQWGDMMYDSKVSVTADKSAPAVKDDDGNRYYDNTATLVIDGPKGQIFSREFRKGDFSSYIDTGYLKPSKSTVLGIVFNKVENGNALFVATVGSPDTMADEYMLVGISISKAGGVTMSRIEETE